MIIFFFLGHSFSAFLMKVSCQALRRRLSTTTLSPYSTLYYANALHTTTSVAGALQIGACNRFLLRPQISGPGTSLDKRRTEETVSLRLWWLKMTRAVMSVSFHGRETD